MVRRSRNPPTRPEGRAGAGIGSVQQPQEACSPSIAWTVQPVARWERGGPSVRKRSRSDLDTAHQPGWRLPLPDGVGRRRRRGRRAVVITQPLLRLFGHAAGSVPGCRAGRPGRRRWYRRRLGGHRGAPGADARWLRRSGYRGVGRWHPEGPSGRGPGGRLRPDLLPAQVGLGRVGAGR